jgi:hypothetical protein
MSTQGAQLPHCSNRTPLTKLEPHIGDCIAAFGHALEEVCISGRTVDCGEPDGFPFSGLC